MISQEDILKVLPRTLESSFADIEIVKFDQDAFRCPSFEQHIQIHRGKRVDFNSVVQFWVCSLRSQDWSGREAYFLPYLKSGKCQTISEVEFNDLVATYSGELEQTLKLPLHFAVGFIGAVQMYNDWDDIGAVAEYEDEFVAFYWNTTA